MTRTVTTLASAALALLLSLPAAAEPPVPLLWRIDADAGSVYLLGSVHLLKPSDYPLSPLVDAAYGDSEELVFELSPADMQSGAVSARMMRLGSLPAGETLRDHVSDETWSEVERYVAGGGYLPMSAIERMRPWFLALTLSVMEMQRAGLDPSFGIELHFMRALAADGKPALGLETVDQQLALFADSSAEEQDQQLQQTLSQLGEMPDQLEKMHALWRAGDGEALHALVRTEMKDFPALYDRLIADRNRAWIAPIEAQLADPGGEMIVVGAAHLIGDDGVVALLRERGHDVVRVR